MRILKRVPNSRLFLYTDNDVAHRFLRAEAELQGVSTTRIVFGARLTFDRYMARFGAMDLFLDTWPYNAGTTASDALWAGLPVLTYAGDAFASRMAASLLCGVGQPQMITKSIAEYEERAVKLASSPDELRNLRSELQDGRDRSLLFDTQKFARSLEQAFHRMHQNATSSGFPTDITV
jgi:predicted O-linked N-acetylglucosamine transferase (SPINDLY family)